MTQFYINESIDLKRCISLLAELPRYPGFPLSSEGEIILASSKLRYKSLATWYKHLILMETPQIDSIFPPVVNFYPGAQLYKAFLEVINTVFPRSESRLIHKFSTSFELWFQYHIFESEAILLSLLTGIVEFKSKRHHTNTMSKRIKAELAELDRALPSKNQTSSNVLSEADELSTAVIEEAKRLSKVDQWVYETWRHYLRVSRMCVNTLRDCPEMQLSYLNPNTGRLVITGKGRKTPRLL